MIDPIILLRFNEHDSALRPRDDAEALEDLWAADGTPAVIEDGITGPARSFDPAFNQGFQAVDRESGTTLLNRDVSIRAILRWSYVDQDGSGFTSGQIIARGSGASAPEYMPWALRIRSIVPAAVGIVEMQWHDIAGVLKTQIGGHFEATDDFILLTATRRWVSTTEVRVRYWLADELLAEVISEDGSIGGGTTGTTYVGHVDGSFFFAGAIDSIQVYDRELTREEIEGTWNRLRYWQPRSRHLIRELHPPGFPMSDDPSSRIQKENAIWGDGIGYIAAQIETIRKNTVPSRAYGRALTEWEATTRTPPVIGDSIETRRARVCARWSQRLGMSVEGLSASLETLLATDFENLELLGFSPTWRDDFTALDDERWTAVPLADWSISAGQLHTDEAAAVDLQLTGVLQNWKHCEASIGGDGKGAHMLAKLVPTDIPEDCEAGIYLGDLAAGNVLLFGLRFDGADFATFVEAFRGWVSQGEVAVDVVDNIAPAAIWLHMYHEGTGTADIENFRVEWSTDDAMETVASINTAPAIAHPRKTHWAGFYLRSLAGVTSDPVAVEFDDVIVREPKGHRAFMFYIYRDPALPGDPDLVGANNVLRQLAHAHLHVHVITDKSLLCDELTSPVDGGCMGGF